MVKVPYDFGLRLKELREAKGWTQQELGDLLNINKSTISSYENNYAQPSFEIIKQLAVLFRVTTDYLFGLESRRTFVAYNLNDEKKKLIDDFIDFLNSISETAGT